MKRVRTKIPNASLVDVVHYIGGPCDEVVIASCIVPGGSGCGWTILDSLEEAVRLACSRATSMQGGIQVGESVRLVQPQSRPDLNGKLGLAIKFSESRGVGQWLIRFGSGEVVQIPPTELEGLEVGRGRVLAFWGHASWTRVQLLGEIARGHWGLCRATVTDLVLHPAERWLGLDGRLVYAPVTEMTDKSLEEAHRQMTADHAGLIQHAD